MISAQKLEWNNLDSLEFDLITCLSFDDDNGNVSSFLNQDGIYTEHYDGHRTIHRAKTNEFFTPTFTFLKEGYEDFNPEEQRRVLSWLSVDKPGWLNVYQDDSNVISFRCFGVWESIELYKLGNNRVVGFVVGFASTHPYAFSHLMTWPSNLNNIAEYEFQQNTGISSYKIECETDEYGKALFPKITIEYDKTNIYFPVLDGDNPKDPNYPMIPNVIYSYGANMLAINIDGGKHSVTSLTSEGEDLSAEGYNYGIYYYSPTYSDIRTVVEGKTSGTKVWQTVAPVRAAVQIENKYQFNGNPEHTKTWVAGGTKGETIILDGANKIVYNKTQTDKGVVNIIGDAFNWEWLPLAYGTNDITITGNCKIKFEWVEPRKIGSL